MAEAEANLCASLHLRELGHRPWRIPELSKASAKQMDEEYSGIAGFVGSLRAAVVAVDWDEVEVVVGDIIVALLDNSNVNQLFAVTPKKKLQRECFVLLGGLDLLLQLFQPPFVSHPDARHIRPEEVLRKAEIWNEIVVILREVSFAIPSLADKQFKSGQMVFFFTLLSHQSVFDNTMNLLEEVLASRDDTFQLSLVPDFHQLVRKFSARQLAHFCRVLSLLLFEPEDRHVMENSHVIHSAELLQVRRNKMARCTGVVERNQSLVIDMPEMLPRLVQILRVINFGPNLAELISHNIVSQVPITSDILTFFSSSMGVSDWDHFYNLEKIVQDDSVQRASASTSSSATSSASGSPARGWGIRGMGAGAGAGTGVGTGTGVGAGSLATLDDDDITAELLNSFSPGSDSNPRSMDLSNIVSVMTLGRNLGIADMTPLGEALLVAQPSYDAPARDGADGGARTRRSRRMNAAARLSDMGPGRAKKELQFHAMLLAPHQIELIFVLCTLLSGRRKISVQRQFAQAGLDRVLLGMFDRMSWDTPPPHRASGAHIHGPGCECDPESALRVQFLRLIHNFYDRDFLGNSNKLLMLSAEERQFVASEQEGLYLDTSTQGILSKTIATLLREAPDSLYKFWLSACVENFLRGCGRMGQALVSRYGVVEHTLRHIVSQPTSTSLQTSFDLLGELVKCNHRVLARVEAELSDEEFERLVGVVMGNLVDSNVFVRSLYLSLGMLGYSYAIFDRQEEEAALGAGTDIRAKGAGDRAGVGAGVMLSPDSGLARLGYHLNTLNSPQEGLVWDGQGQGQGREGYLVDTWVQFEPAVLSPRALAMYQPKEGRKVRGGRERESREGREGGFSEGREGSGSGGSGGSGREGRERERTGSASALSSLGSGVMGALKDMRKATKGFWKMGGEASPSPTPASPTPKSSWGASGGWGSGVSSGGVNSSAGREKDLGDEKDEGDGIYYDCASSTPPDAVKYSRAIPTVATSSSATYDGLGKGPGPGFESFEAHSGQREIEQRESERERERERERVRSSPLQAQVPPNLRRLGAFLMDQKVTILLRLMSTVSLKTVNHENICCLNTVLLVLLMEHQRGRMAATMRQVRALADREYDKTRREKERELLGELPEGVMGGLGGMGLVEEEKEMEEVVCCVVCGAPEEEEAEADTEVAAEEAEAGELRVKAEETVGADTSSGGGSVGKSSAKPRRQKMLGGQLRFGSGCTAGCCTESAPASASVPASPSFSESLSDSLSAAYSAALPPPFSGTDDDASTTQPQRGSLVAFTNFRELMWYWQEYYLRRGRDRLSIEFSSHIPFRHWRHMVSLLCADDGSPTALLDAPTPLPRSPYSQTTDAALPGSHTVDQNAVVNL
ncbi:hypothetical protein B484DRAFT_416580 [Ochromonadaceae sp. CCMP2298]|nr:hypothetical protein B484DRAFT_416580 [Ochromonadaceae sp. CCMP2298]